jgi:hypothetical protein
MNESIYDKKQILQNLVKSTEKLKDLFNLVNKYYEIHEIVIDDKDISPNYGLYMVLYRVIIKIEMDNPSIEELSGELEELEKVFESSFRKVSFDKFGLIKKPTSENITYTGSLVNSLIMQNDVMTLDVHCNFMI